MNSNDAARNTQRRMLLFVVAYTFLFALQELAHGKLDQLWTMEIQLSTLVVFIGGPILGTALLLTRVQRGGAILLLGSLPAGLVFLVVTRFFSSRPVLPPVEESGLWKAIFEISYMLLLLLAALGSALAVQIIRRIHLTESGERGAAPSSHNP